MRTRRLFKLYAIWKKITPRFHHEAYVVFTRDTFTWGKVTFLLYSVTFCRARQTSKVPTACFWGAPFLNKRPIRTRSYFVFVSWFGRPIHETKTKWPSSDWPLASKGFSTENIITNWWHPPVPACACWTFGNTEIKEAATQKHKLKVMKNKFIWQLETRTKYQ